MSAAREDPNEIVRHEAMSSLARIGDPRALPLLRELEAVCSFTGMGEAGMVAMLDFFRTGRTADLRSQALLCLCGAPLNRASVFVSDPRAGEAVVAALQEATPTVRIAGVQCARFALERAKAIESLKASLSDPDRGVRSAAADQLGRLGDSSGFDDMVATVRDRSLPERDRVGAALALAEIGDRRAIPVLLAIVQVERPGETRMGNAAQSGLSRLAPVWDQSWSPNYLLGPKGQARQP